MSTGSLKGTEKPSGMALATSGQCQEVIVPGQCPLHRPAHQFDAHNSIHHDPLLNASTSCFASRWKV